MHISIDSIAMGVKYHHLRLIDTNVIHVLILTFARAASKNFKEATWIIWKMTMTLTTSGHLLHIGLAFCVMDAIGMELSDLVTSANLVPIMICAVIVT